MKEMTPFEMMDVLERASANLCEAGSPGIGEYKIDTTIIYKGKIKVYAYSQEEAEEAIEEDIDLKESPLFKPSSSEDWDVEVKAK